MITKMNPVQEEAWVDEAACRGMETNDWFVDGKGATWSPAFIRAVEVCGRCPVRGECFEYAKRNRMRDGVWGGVNFGSQHVRNKINKRDRDRKREQTEMKRGAA